MAAFRFTNEVELEDLYLQGRRYTRSNQQADAIKVKLDMVQQINRRLVNSSDVWTMPWTADN
jgi:hypothetical protein